MASPQLAIAKVSFSAVLLRPDPVSCPRPEIDEFFAQLDATLLRCSPANVQKSKQWILNHIVQSKIRIAALGRYLTALANSFTVDIAASRQSREPSSKRRRLHVLYVLNDVLYHTFHRQRETGFSSQLESFLQALVQSAAAFGNCPKHAKKISDIVRVWSEHKYFSDNFIAGLQDTIRDAPNSASASIVNGTTDSTTAGGAKLPKDTPYIMPAMHGDANIPWHELPAANWLPVIEPNSTRPMNPSMIKPLQFLPGPADKSLVEAVQSLLADVDRIYAKDYCLGENPAEDINMLGQRIVLDEETGAVVGGDTYYGWSRNFCEKMKKRRKGTDGSEDSRGRGLSRSQSRSSSRSSSRPAFKRWRASDSRSRSRSLSGSRSRSRRDYSRDREHRRSYSRSRSPSPRRARRYSRSRSRSQNYSPPPPQPLSSKGYEKHESNIHQGYPAPHTQPPFQPAPHSATYPFGVTPPPPPPNWQGPWPPPPPPPPPTAGPNWMPGVPLPVPPPMASGWSAPIPPPPAPPSAPFNGQQGQYQGGHVQYGGHGGRGDYRGGRGGYKENRGGR